MWNNLEHTLWNKLKHHGLDQQSVYLLAVSGGLDSMALAEVFRKTKPQAKLVLMHYHHGDGDNKSYRDLCLHHVEKKADQGFIFESDKSVKELRSENEFREARRTFFDKIKFKYQTDFYVTAHHLDDVLETRLLKLIRGTGIEGLKSFQEWNGVIFRPFFETAKKTLYQYAEMHRLTWVDDPTNKDNQYLRNWLRNEWLPSLEDRSVGAVTNLANSLENILQARNENDRYQSESARYVAYQDEQMTIDRTWLDSFNTKDQLSVLIRALKSGFQGDFTTSQVKEVLRRLDKNQKEQKFAVAGINWVINARNIVLSYSTKK